MLGALAVSTAVHAFVLVGLAVVGRFAWPAAPIPIEMVTPKPRVVRPPTAPPAPPPPPPSGARVAAHNKEGISTPKAAKPEPTPPPATSDLKPFAPDDANLVVLLCSQKLRASPHRQSVETLLSALPDYNTLLGGSGMSPLQDLEALLIATNDPRSITATFLAASYVDSPKMRALTDRPLMVGDPRVFRTLRPGLTVLTRPEGAAKLDAALTGGADGGDDPRVRWLHDLEQFDHVARATDGPALLVTISDVQELMRFGGGLPTPLAMALAMTAEASPSLRLKAVFASADEAEQLVQAWPEIVKRWRTAVALVGLSPMLDGLTATRHDAEVEIVGRLPEKQMQLALAFALQLAPHNPDGGAP
jgi:hypothetical protein